MKPYVTSDFSKKLDNLVNSIPAVASKAVSAATSKVAQNRAFEMKFDETETVKFSKDSKGMIVFPVGDTDDFSIQDMLNTEAENALNTLTTEVSNGIKEALNGRLIR